jgi:chemotaxis protein CheX
MDVKFINPFLDGTMEVLSKMAFIQPIAGKPFAKKDDIACGDVSGIIGMTGDAIGSLALTFNEECIIYLTNKILNENHKEINKDVLDAVGELTNMISGAARKLMDKNNLTVFAAIPTVVFGKNHTVRHVIKSPSIVIPFQTEKGQFVIDICLMSQIKQKDEQSSIVQRSMTTRTFNPQNLNPAVFGNPSVPKAGPEISQDKINKDLSKLGAIGQGDIGNRISKMKQLLDETSITRNAIMKQLKEQPFMEWQQRQRYKKALPSYDAKIKRLKLDITAAETLAKMSKDDFENPKIKPHFQHYSTETASHKVEEKK